MDRDKGGWNRTALDLFSGVGGFALAASWAGWETVAFCEIEPYCRQVLAKHWPGVPICHDIRELTIEYLRGLGIAPIGLVTLGFPCQDISAAGNGAGLGGAKSSLWFEGLRIIRECLPVWVVVENSPLLRIRGADVVLEGLEALGYACWSHVVGSDDAGAPHRRKRTVIVARRWRGDGEGPLLDDPDNDGRFGYARDASPQQDRDGTNHGVFGAASKDGQQLGDALFMGRAGEPWRRAGEEPADGHLGNEEGAMADASDPERWQDDPGGRHREGELSLSSGREQGASRSGAGCEVANSDGERRKECGAAALTSESRFACERHDCGEGALGDPDRDGQQQQARTDGEKRGRAGDGGEGPVADAQGLALGAGLREGEPGGVGRRRSGDGAGEGCGPVADADNEGTGRGEPFKGSAPKQERRTRSKSAICREPQSLLDGAAHGISSGLDGDHIGRWPAGRGEPQYEWEAPRLAEKVKNREARLRGIGNAVNPQMFYPILRIIRDMEEEIWQTQ